MNRYIPAFTGLAVFAATVLTAPLNTASGIIQAATALLGAAIIYLLPLLNTRHQFEAKIAAGIVAAGLIAAAPLVLDGHLSADDWRSIGLAAINPFATAWGVKARSVQEALDAATAAATELPEETPDLDGAVPEVAPAP